ncbi:radical SAM/SPASM domain-containing protein [Paenibacillus silagei]|uniref:Radical SAM core domain-containing protein n=1 Tax=Paenibacillus silagei TaxID=1670801 RepID=A0ABS4NZF1_9BACL|nr:radical SAM protein [Paenibacillus silagei]MBP2115447.1 uncharacterized protein [Paenibacillus silagei]
MLSKLTLIVTHNCNLNCNYCYAMGGDYGLPVGQMSKEEAIKIVEHFWNAFNGIKEIFFFGGEPLLAIDTIESLCIHLKNKVKERKIKELPLFTLISNGTRVNQRFALIAKKYCFDITISIDGPKEIHNTNRKLKSGNGSFDKAIKGISILKKHNIPFSIECTYTKEHIENSHTPLSIYKYLQSFGPNKIIITEQLDAKSEYVNNSSKEDYKNNLYNSAIELFKHAIDECKSCGTLNHAGLHKSYDSLLNKPKGISQRFCGAGINNFAVNPTGETYPCHMFNNQVSFSLGTFQNVDGPVEIIPKKEDYEACSTCPVKSLCRSCPARMYFYHDSEKIAPIESECKIIMSYSCLAMNSIQNK